MNTLHCRDCFVETNKLYPETARTTEQMFLCGKAEYEQLERAQADPTFNYDKLAFFKCMLMLRSDRVFDKRETFSVNTIAFDQGMYRI